MKRNVLTHLLMLLCITVIAQSPRSVSSFTLKGTLVDSLTLEGEPYATIRVSKKETPSQPVKMAVTDTSGKFSEKVTGTGEFMIILTSVGKTSVTKHFTVTATDTTIDLGTLYIQEASNELTGIEIVAQKPLVRVNVDKIEYNIQDDPDSKTNHILEMLRKVPLVTVDGEDNIQVNGSSNFKIHINGKPNNMVSNNPAHVLKSMPANTIKHIEVITSPGARYDAEGVGGILNIVTMGTGFEGYTANVNTSVSNIFSALSAYATTKKEKLTLTANYAFNRQYSPAYTANRIQEYIHSTDERYYGQNEKGRTRATFQYGNVEASYDFNPNNLLTVNMGLYKADGDQDTDRTIHMSDVHYNPVYSYQSKGDVDFSWHALIAGADYQRSFRTKGRLFTLSYKTEIDARTNEAETEYENMIHVPEALLLTDNQFTTRTSTQEHTLQADYTTPLGEYHTVETGVKYISRNNESRNKHFDKYTEGTDYTYNENRSIHYKHLNDIVAAYAGYTLQYKNFSFKPGIRYEHTRLQVKYTSGKGENFHTGHNDIVPSVTLGTKIGKTRNIRGGYNLRIWRPNISQLNPYINDVNPLNLYYGNPNLDTEKTHAFNINYSRFSAKFNINLSFQHSFTNNSIERYSFMKDEVVNTTFGNIGEINKSTFSLYANWNATPKTRIYTNSSVNYQDYKSSTGLVNSRNHGWEATFSGGIQHTLPCKVRVSLNGGTSTPRIMLQSRTSSYYYYGINLNRSFIKDKLTISIYGNNLFSPYRKSISRLYEDNFTQRVQTNIPTRRFGFNVSYRMGDLKAKVKKAARTIHNDDIKNKPTPGAGM